MGKHAEYSALVARFERVDADDAAAEAMAERIDELEADFTAADWHAVYPLLIAARAEVA